MGNVIDSAISGVGDSDIFSVDDSGEVGGEWGDSVGDGVVFVVLGADEADPIPEKIFPEFFKIYDTF